MALEQNNPLEQAASDPNKERQEDVQPIQVKCATPEEFANKCQKIVDELSSKHGVWDSWRKPLEDMWNQIYRMYFSQPDVSKTPSRSKVFIPVIFQIIESTVPKVINSLFGSEEVFDVVPTNPKDQPIADVIKLLLNYQLVQADFFIKFLEFVKQLSLYGTSYFFVYWKVTRKWVVTRTPNRVPFKVLGYDFSKLFGGSDEGVVSFTEKKEYKVVERRPEIKLLDILDVYPDPDCQTEADAEGVFVQSWENIQDIKELGKGKFPVYQNTDSPLLASPKENSFGTSRQARRSTRGVSNVVQGREDQVSLLTYWGKYDLDGDGIREEVQIVIANKQVLLKAGPNPFDHQKRPIVRAVLFPVVGEWFGMGLVEPVMSLVHELNTLRRQRLDNINQCINAMWKVLSWSDIDLDTLVSSPNGIILVDDMNALERLEGQNVTNQAYMEAGIVQTDIQNTTAPSSIQGSPDSSKLGRTARGAQMIIGQALEKFGTASKLLEEMGIKKVLRLFHQLNLQFIDNDEILRDPGLYGHLFDEAITPEMIRGEVDFVMKGISDLTSREGKINQIMSFMGIFGKVLSPKTITALAQKIWSLMGFPTSDIEIGAVQPMPPDINLQGASEAVASTQANPVASQLNQNGIGGPPAVGGK